MPNIPGIIEGPANKVDGYKTYIIAIAGAVLGILELAEIWTMPTAGWLILGALGLGGIRSAMKK